MNIKDLLPPELMSAVTNTIKGTLTLADQKYLKEKCQLEVGDLIFNLDGSTDIVLKTDHRTRKLAIYSPEEGLFEGFCDEPSYLYNAYLVILSKLCSELPSWVGDSSKFYLNWSILGEYSLPEIDIAYNEAWEMVFNNGSPGWRKDRKLQSSILTQLILNEMLFSLGNPGSRRRTAWLGYDDVARFANPVLDVQTLLILERLYDRELEIEPSNKREVVNTENTYISPFTGQAV